MKLKRVAEDFRVEEQTALPATGGSFALYRLTKRSLGTLEAIDAVCQRWNVPRPHIAFGGLKDKHAVTSQFITIRQGPRRGLKQASFHLHYLGQTRRAIHASDIQANRFAVVIRDLTEQQCAAAITAIAGVTSDGLPNYFDDQRFGSLGDSGDFIARPWCLGDFERTVWLAIADSNEHDRFQESEEKRLLRERWGDWNQCRPLRRNTLRYEIVAHLAKRPGDFRRAVSLIPQDIRSLWLAAFQSQLWNSVLAAWITQICRADQCFQVPVKPGQVPFFSGLDLPQCERLTNTLLPLPSARLHLVDSPLKPIYDRVMAAHGMELRQVRVKYPRDSFFSKGERAATVTPGDFRHAVTADDLYAGRLKITLHFILPRGSYATILVKRLLGPAALELASDSAERD